MFRLIIAGDPTAYARYLIGIVRFDWIDETRMNREWIGIDMAIQMMRSWWIRHAFSLRG